jgi:two-component sensor histidine kinase
LLEQGKKYQYRDHALADTLVKRAFLIAQKDHLKEAAAEAKCGLGWLSYIHEKGGNEHAITDLEICLNLLSGIQNPVLKARAHGILAGIYSDRENLKDTKIQQQEARKLLNGLPDTPETAWVNALLAETDATVAFQTRDSSKILSAFLKSQEQYHQAGDRVRAAGTLMKIGQQFMMPPFRYDNARAYFKRSLAEYQGTGFIEGIQNVYKEYLTTYLYEYAETNKEQCFNEMLDLFQASKVALGDESSCVIYSRVGNVYHQRAELQKEGSTEKRVYLDSANYFYRLAIVLARKERDLECLSFISQNIGATCRDKKACMEVLDSIASCYVSLFSTEKDEADRARKTIEQYRESQEAEQRQQAIREKRELLAAFAVIALIGIGISFFIYQRQRIRNLRHELEGRMAALRAQMNPHFISNVLNAIDSLVNQNRNQEASHYIIQFSRLCRIILNNSRSNTISLQEELNTLRYFLNLEQLRLGENLQFSIETDKSLNTEEIRLPPMLIQPFVENAIWHGIQPKQAPGMIRIRVARKSDDLYECIVEDDGIGREKSRMIKENQLINQLSWGLTITQERIETIEKIKGSQLITEDLYHPDHEPAGTRITVILPIHTTEKQKP